MPIVCLLEGVCGVYKVLRRPLVACFSFPSPFPSFSELRTLRSYSTISVPLVNTMSSTENPAEPAPLSATYTGSCHCGRFKYNVTHSPSLTDPASEVTDCNCSICTRNGYLLIYVQDKNIVFEKGSVDDFTVCPSPIRRIIGRSILEIVHLTEG